MKKYLNKFTFKHFSEKKQVPSKLVQIIKKLNIESPEEKDLRIEDELFYFEKEWKNLQDDKKKLFQDYYTKDLTDHQQRECDLLIERYFSFSPSERIYFQYMLHNNVKAIICSDPYRPNVFEKEKSIKVDINLPGTNPNNNITEEILYELLPYISSGYFTGGATQKIEVAAKAEEKPKEDKPKEVNLKLNFRKRILMLSLYQ
jgi:hypothetical protein